MEGLSDPQLTLIESIINKLNVPYEIIWSLGTSDLAVGDFVNLFGDYLKVHHCLSREALSKDRFEYALESICNQVGLNAALAERGNPGQDISINGSKYSLKTQADKKIKDDELWISKFMELGKGEWTDKIEHLQGLRNQFIEHMSSYERIFQLRCLSNNSKKYNANTYHYELIEIPKALMLEATNGVLAYSERSVQIPKIGTCSVLDSDGAIKFQLYFDGGGERKLHIKKLQKNLCIKHAEWKFSLETL
ncbi:MAG: restriction endonuclease [gamma proteobacterium endosymbiont of Lamellibrachia anaximandri]|nr:restriction endonuclease [gamma proteobacterium endosymbiont of Lamellibrachia anaximandri]